MAVAHRGEYLNNLSAARGSLREVDTHLEFALRLNYTSESTINSVRELLDEVAALLTRLIIALKEKGNRPHTGSQFPVPRSRTSPATPARAPVRQ